MNSIFLFLLKSVLVSGILTTWYLLGLRNKRLHNYNRFFLLFTLYASIQLPLFHFQWFSVPKAAKAFSPVSFLIQTTNDELAIEQHVSGPSNIINVNWNVVLITVSIIISLYLLTALFISVAWIIKMSGKYPRTRVEGIDLINTGLPNAPFSFLTYLFWKDSISLDSESGRMIFQHELTHIREKHTYDKLACQVLTCICWMNPFYWLIQKELAMIHEFIADEKAVSENDTEAFAKMLLQSHNNGRYLIPEHQFFSSPIKRRLIMLQTSRKTSHAWLRRMMVLPLIGCAILIFSFTNRKEAKYEIVRADKKIVLVVDPGHGGNDAGCSYGSLVEKDLNLRISKRIKELSPEFNVEVYLTRSGDEYPTLEQRVAYSNKMHPDDFISIHVSDMRGKDMGKGNYEIAVNYQNQQAEKSKRLASEIYQYLTPPEGSQRNTPTEKGLYVLRNNSAPGVLIEMGDIKNKEQMERITNQAKLDELCGAILTGVVKSHQHF